MGLVNSNNYLLLINGKINTELNLNSNLQEFAELLFYEFNIEGSDYGPIQFLLNEVIYEDFSLRLDDIGIFYDFLIVVEFTTFPTFPMRANTLKDRDLNIEYKDGIRFELTLREKLEFMVERCLATTRKNGNSYIEIPKYLLARTDHPIEINTIQQKIEDIENLESKIRKFENNLENLNDYKKIGKEKESIERLISEKHKRQNDLNKFIDDMERRIHNNKQDINLILEKYKFKNLTQLTQFKKELRNEFEHQKKILDNYNSQKLEFEKDLSTKEENSKHLKDQLETLKKFVKLKKELKENLEYVSNLREWVSDKFPILLRDIETEILFSSAQHFNEYFKEWFKILVEDENIEVEIRPDDFEPIINVNGYESPFSDLSGGEKSALSLSYRLALNKIINDKYQDIKTKDFLILDEPTSDLDPIGRVSIISDIRRLSKTNA